MQRGGRASAVEVQAGITDRHRIAIGRFPVRVSLSRTVLNLHPMAVHGSRSEPRKPPSGRAPATDLYKIDMYLSTRKEETGGRPQGHPPVEIAPHCLPARQRAGKAPLPPADGAYEEQPAGTDRRRPYGTQPVGGGTTSSYLTFGPVQQASKSAISSASTSLSLSRLKHSQPDATPPFHPV